MCDQFFAIDGIDALEQRLSAANVGYAFNRYDVKHDFANEQADAMNLTPLGYNPDAAALAWQRTEAFFAKNLR